MLRLSAAKEYIRSSLWVLPTVAVLAALALGTVLSALSIPMEGNLLAPLVPAVGPDGARVLLGTVAGAMITVTSLVFSLTVVALQLAASNYSPRLLRQFVRDLGNQVVLATFLATFAYSYAVLRTIRAGTEDTDPFVPSLAVDLLLVFVLASIAALVYFIHHITQSIRVERILDEVLEETIETLERTCADPDEHDAATPREPLPDIPPRATTLAATRSGEVQALELGRLARKAEEADVTVRLRPAVGDHVVAGTCLAWLWPGDGRDRLSQSELDTLAATLDDAMQVGRERTMQSDVAYGVRQLVDIALRAISPGINDPTTASQAFNRIAVILAALAVRPLPNMLRRDTDGVLRVAVPSPDFREYLALACDQVRHYGADDAVLISHVLAKLAEVRSLAVSAERRREIDVQVRAIQERRE